MISDQLEVNITGHKIRLSLLIGAVVAILSFWYRYETTLHDHETSIQQLRVSLTAASEQISLLSKDLNKTQAALNRLEWILSKQTRSSTPSTEPTEQ